MVNYSIWNFNKYSDLNSFLDTINSNRLVTRYSGNSRGNLELKSEISKVEGFELEIRNIKVGRRDVAYIMFNANAEGCTKNIELDSYEVKEFEKKVIAYESEGVVKVVVQATKRNAERIVKKIFGEEEIWGDITEDNYITEDMLYWLFYKLREMPNEVINTDPNIYLNGIVSYLGKTDDKINAVRGVGIRVSALLGTLGMLFGEESLRALRPVIQYGSHEINIEMGIGNTGKLYERSYQGDIAELQGVELENALILLVCKYILPSIKRGYEKNLERKEWSLYIKQTFMRAIGNEMSEKVNRELQMIEKELLKLEEDNMSSMDDLIAYDSEDEEFEELDELENEIEDCD